MTNSRNRDEAGFLDLLHCLARALRRHAGQRAVEQGLLQVHWQTLWFLQSANRYSNNLQTLAAYLGQTKGSVSQTVRWLEARGYVARKQDERDRRVMRLGLTRAGAALLRQIDFAGDWTAALAGLDDTALAAARSALASLLREWQVAHGSATFGVCRSCGHFRIEETGYRCGLTQEALSEAETDLICQAHTPAPNGGSRTRAPRRRRDA
jgi:DNA-binding MarR family transcriptional regulator